MRYMAIPAQRFEGFKRDFNIAVTDFKSFKESIVQNSPIAEIEGIIGEAKELLNQLKESGQDALSNLKDQLPDGVGDFEGAKELYKDASGALATGKEMIADATRFTQDLVGTFTDLTKLPEKMVGDFINDIIPDELSGLKNSISGLAKVCRNNALGGAMGLGSGINPKLGCDGIGGSVGKCPPSKIGNMLSKSGIGAFKSLTGAVGNLVGKIMSLANLGFNADLCNIFAPLIESVTSSPVVATAAGLLINGQGAKGNFNAVRDISKTVVAKGINVPSMFPNAIKNVTGGLNSAVTTSKEKGKQLFDNVTGTLAAVDNEWIGTDNDINISKLSKNNNLKNIFDKGASQNMSLAALDSDVAIFDNLSLANATYRSTFS